MGLQYKSLIIGTIGLSKKRDRFFEKNCLFSYEKNYNYTRFSLIRALLPVLSRR